MGFVSQRAQAGPQPAVDRNAGPKKGKRKEEAMTCLYCGQPLVFDAHGYVHKEGGGTYCNSAVAAATRRPCDQLQSIVLNAAAVIGVTTIAPRPKGASQV